MKHTTAILVSLLSPLTTAVYTPTPHAVPVNGPWTPPTGTKTRETAAPTNFPGPTASESPPPGAFPLHSVPGNTYSSYYRHYASTTSSAVADGRGAGPAGNGPVTRPPPALVATMSGGVSLTPQEAGYWTSDVYRIPMSGVWTTGPKSGQTDLWTTYSRGPEHWVVTGTVLAPVSGGGNATAAVAKTAANGTASAPANQTAVPAVIASGSGARTGQMSAGARVTTGKSAAVTASTAAKYESNWPSVEEADADDAREKAGVDRTHGGQSGDEPTVENTGNADARPDDDNGDDDAEEDEEEEGEDEADDEEIITVTRTRSHTPPPSHPNPTQRTHRPSTTAVPNAQSTHSPPNAKRATNDPNTLTSAERFLLGLWTLLGIAVLLAMLSMLCVEIRKRARAVGVERLYLRVRSLEAAADRDVDANAERG